MSFHVFRGEERLRTETLTQDIVKIGKLASSHLRIDDEGVSRMHAVIEVSGDGDVHVIDLGSSSGTIVNGKKVNKHRLESGDELLLGAHRVVVELDAVRAETNVAAPAPEPVRVAAASPFASPFAPPIPAPIVSPFAFSGAVAAPVSVAAAHEEPHAHDDDAIRYGIAASGPPIDPADVESSASAVEVTLMWGDRSVLHVAHLSPPRAFYVGERTPDLAPDYLLGQEVLGSDRMPLVLEVGGQTAVVIPSGAEGAVTIGAQSATWAQLAAEDKLAPCAEIAGAMQYVLPHGATAEVIHRGFSWRVKPTSMGRKVGVGGAPVLGWQQQTWTIVSLALHASFLLMFYFLPPRPASLSLDLLSSDSRLVEYLLQPPETIEEETPTWLQPDADETEGGTGQAHRDDSGQMGEETSEHTTNRYAIEGPQDNPDPHMAREEARERAATVGAIGVLQTLQGSWAAPTSPYGQDTALGADPMSALGALMGDQIGSNFGFGGLGPNGTGRGGGGDGTGTIGLGRLGTIGHGAGRGPGNGYGDGVGDFRGTRGPVVPRIRGLEAEVRGSLSREVIRRVIRTHINEVRFCYEQELHQRPDLAGRVSISFIIGATGAVQIASVQSSTLGNSRVEGCMVQAVRRWSFPAPDGGGIVGVNYPFVLDSN